MLTWSLKTYKVSVKEAIALYLPEMWGKILLPLDGSKSAETALSYGSALGQLLDAEIYLLRVCADASEAQRICWPYITKTADQLRIDLGSFAANVHQRVAVGEVNQEIQRYAAENTINAIIATVSGLSGLAGHKMGRTAKNLVETASLPVLIVAPKDNARPSKNRLFRQIVLPLDGTLTSEAAIPYLTPIAKSIKASLLLLRVGADQPDTRDRGAPLASLGFDAKKVQARRYMYEMAARFYGVKAKVTIDTELGDPVAVTAERAKKINANLIAFSRSFSGIIDRWLDDSAANDGEQHDPLSFLVIPLQT
jgi:nucleotide-binding universal stress UspA family protein